MPPVSDRQKRAMWAAANGNSTLGIPQSVGKEFVGDAAGNGKHAAGVVFVAPDGDVLLLRRASTEKNYGGHWGLPGGGGEDGESPEQTARREVTEEMGGAAPEVAYRPMNRRQTPTGMVFHTFACPVEEKFIPTLDGEHTGYAWASLDMLPRPLHPSVAEDLGANLGAAEDMAPEDWKSLRENFVKWTREEQAEPEHAEDAAIDPSILEAIAQQRAAGATPQMAFDWAMKLQESFPAHRPTGGVFAFDRDSVRDFDRDGRMHVKIANVSKACINPYLGSEIPDYEKLGLAPDKIYNLLRHPEELERAAATFNNLPLLDDHVAVNAQDHKPDRVVGSLGTHATYEHPFLKNNLVVWAKHAIDGIESDEQRELSSSYRYRADMTPGVYEGDHYDGVMRDIVGNHVALVKKGRAGTDVVVGDSQLQENETMKTTLTRSGLFAMGAIAAAITPILAKDAALDLSSVTKKLVPGKSLKDQRGAIMDGLKTLKLAKDASLDSVVGLLDKLDDAKGVDDAMEPNAAPVVAAGEAEKDEAMDDGAGARIAEYLRGCIGRALTEEDIAKVAEMAAAPAATDADPKDQDPAAPTDPKANDEDDDDKIDKKAMDAALKATADRVRADTLKVVNEIAGARDFIEPWVGKISASMAFDSADGVYGQALKMLGVETKGIHPSAFKAVLSAQPKANAAPAKRLANDSASKGDAASFAETFPNLAKVGIG